MSETILPELPQELWRAGKLELAHGVRQFLQVMRVVSAELGQYLAEIESRGAKDLYGYGTTVSWFADIAGLSAGEARPYVHRAIDGYHSADLRFLRWLAVKRAFF